MSTTLKDMIAETADYVKIDLTDEDDSAQIEGRIKSALNEAKNIVGQRIRLSTSEEKVLDVNSCFDTETLTKPFWGLVGVKENRVGITTSEQNGLIWCSASPGATVSVEYEYIPSDMVAETDVFPFPAAVSWRLLCYYAAARFYEIKGTASSLNKYRYWMNEWESGLYQLRGGSKMAKRRIQATYNYGDFE